MNVRHAQCSCGQLKASARGEPIRISVCHCYNCQRRTGSPFAAQARWPRDQVTLEGRSTAYKLVGDSGNSATFHFCPACGATVHYQIDHMPEVVAIPLGAFADNTFPPPRFSVYESRQHPWITLAEPLERFD
jgi:hypothetical protein